MNTFLKTPNYTPLRRRLSEGDDSAIGVARFGNGIMISRHYRAAETGVYALTPPNVIVTESASL